jgi:hypothetical protein
LDGKVAQADGRPNGSKNPRPPANESEELAYYKARENLRELAIREDRISDEMITIYRQQCKFITMVRKFMSWDAIGELMGLPAHQVKYRYGQYVNEKEEEN